MAMPLSLGWSCCEFGLGVIYEIDCRGGLSWRMPVPAGFFIGTALAFVDSE